MLLSLVSASLMVIRRTTSPLFHRQKAQTCSHDAKWIEFGTAGGEPDPRGVEVVRVHFSGDLSLILALDVKGMPITNGAGEINCIR